VQKGGERLFQRPGIMGLILDFRSKTCMATPAQHQPGTATATCLRFAKPACSRERARTPRLLGLVPQHLFCACGAASRACESVDSWAMLLARVALALCSATTSRGGGRGCRSG